MKRPTIIFAILFTVCAVSLAAFRFYTNNSVDDRITSCEAEGYRKQQCFAELIEAVAKKDGIAPAFDALATVYSRDKEFAEFCHGNTHELGRIAYEKWSTGESFSLSDKTPYCGFGFYHGFIEALMEHEGDIMRARAFCEYADAQLSETIQGISFACYHGIGHGVTDGTDPSLWRSEDAYIAPGLALCDTLGAIEEHKERCASGVFNALAIAYRNPKYSLKADPQDPYRVCRKQKIRYAREACYDQMNTLVVETAPTFEKALQVAVSKSESAYRNVAVMTVAGYQAQNALAGSADLGAFVRACDSVPALYRDVCAYGFAVGLIEFGKPGEEYVAALRACGAANNRKEACINGLVQGVRDRVPKSRLKDVCGDIGAQTGEHVAAMCLNGPVPTP